jgi:hypothetical protein
VPSPPRPFPALALAAFALATLPGAARGALRCDSTTALTLIGIDTRAGRALFAVPARGGGEAWLLQADLEAGAVEAYVESASGGPRLGSSIGPGPVLAARRCGDRCLQPIAFRDGAWHPVGEPLLAPDTASVQGAWDRAGGAWIVLQSLGGPETAGGRLVAATAYRLEGGDWRSIGSLAVRAVGSAAVHAAPPGEEGIVVGDGQFLPSGRPRRWIERLPAEVSAGELVWLGGAAAVHLGEDGLLRSTADAGASWQELRWQPWSRGEGDLAWRPGRDYWVELPEGERRRPLLAVWNDGRVPSRPRLHFASSEDGGAWRALVVEAPQGLLVAGGERLPFNHILRVGDRLALVTGCISRAEGPALALRPLEGGRLGEPRVLPVELPAAAPPER